VTVIFSGRAVLNEKTVLPKYDDLFGPTLKVLKAKGGSASVEEINEELTIAIGATQAHLDVTYPKSGVCS